MKIPLVPPLIMNNRVISNCREKANFFDNFFASQCTPIISDSKLTSAVQYRTKKKGLQQLLLKIRIFREELGYLM